jgi:hypothetical protein
MSTAPPVLLLPAALVDPDWLGADRLAAAAADADWAALARRIGGTDEAGPDGPPPNDPGHERWLRSRLGLAGDAPLAVYAACADGVPDAAWRVDPVHLHVGRDHLVMTDPAALELGRDEAHALAGAIAPLLAEDGLALETPTRERWYLRELDPARPLRLRTRALVGATGRNIDAWMPVGEDARRWRRLVNEVQMTWHGHPVNARREEAHRPTVNSLWIEGPLRAPQPGARRDAAARLALRDATRVEVDVGDGTVVLDARLLDAHVAGDPQRWARAWRELGTEAFAQIVRREPPWTHGARVVLAGDVGWRSLDVAPRAGWRFWRRADPAALLVEPGTAPQGAAA